MPRVLWFACLIGTACSNALPSDPQGSPPGGDLGQETKDAVVDPASVGIPEACNLSTVAPRVYRLSLVQFANSITDLLALSQTPVVTGETAATGTFFTSDQATVQSTLALGIRNAVVASVEATDVATLSGCADGPEGLACAANFIEAVASRGWRHPLSDDERVALLEDPASPFVVGAELGAHNAIRLSLRAILQAPSLLYRREFGGAAGQLTDFETATQLGYLLLDSLPDAGLWDAAVAGELNTAGQIEAHVERLFQLPRVQTNVARIVGLWLGTQRVLDRSKEAGLFPGFDEQNINVLLKQSADHFIGQNLAAGGALDGLLGSPTLFVNQELAEWYGLPFSGATPESFVGMDFPGERAGILTQPAVLAATATTTESNVVRRGLYMVRDVLCLPEPPPPPPAILEQARMQEHSEKTEREKVDERASNPTCAACHVSIDPYGLLFENFDAVGRYRSVDAAGNPIDASTDVPANLVSPDGMGTEGETIRAGSALEFISGARQNTQFAVCAHRQLLRYALGTLAVSSSCAESVAQQAGELSPTVTVPDVLRTIVTSSLARVRLSTPTGP